MNSLGHKKSDLVNMWQQFAICKATQSNESLCLGKAQNTLRKT